MFFMTIYLYLYLHLIWGDFLTSNFLNHLQSSIHLPIILSFEVYDEFMSLEPEVRQAPYGMSNTWFFTYFLLKMMYFSCFFYWKTRIWRFLPVKKSTDLRICHVLFCHVLSKCHLLRWPTHQEKVLVVLHDTPCLQPRSLRWNLKKRWFLKGISFSRGWFSGSML